MNELKRAEIQKQIDAYVKGTLSEEQIDDLWVEIAKDPALLDELDIEVHVKELIQNRMGQANEPATEKRMLKWALLVSAAAVMAIVAFIQMFRMEAPARLDQLVLQEISPAELETPEVVRAEDNSSERIDTQLSMGFKYALSGEVEKAMKQFEAVIREYEAHPKTAISHLNMGIMWYNLEEYDQALLSFNRSLKVLENNIRIEEKAYWYSANAHLKNGELEKARDQASRAYELSGVFLEKAYSMIHWIDQQIENNEPGKAVQEKTP